MSEPNPNASDDDYVAWVDGYRLWYEQSVGRWNACLMLCRGLAVVAAVLSALAAANLDQHNVLQLKWVIVAATLVGAASAHILAEFRVVKIEGLRAAGETEARHLAAYARDKLFEFKDDPAARFRIKDEIRERLRQLDLAQGREFFVAHQTETPLAHGDRVNP